MKREKSEIIKDLNETQELLDKYILELGVVSADYFKKNSPEKIPAVNNKVEIIQKIELRLRELENELLQQNN